MLEGDGTCGENEEEEGDGVEDVAHSDCCNGEEISA